MTPHGCVATPHFPSHISRQSGPGAWFEEEHHTPRPLAWERHDSHTEHPAPFLTRPATPHSPRNSPITHLQELDIPGVCPCECLFPPDLFNHLPFLLSYKCGIASLTRPMENEIETARRVKRRAARACSSCRSRKVRCNVVECGPPCINCRLDSVECVIVRNRRHRSVCHRSY